MATFFTGVYGGYFGAAQGVLLMAFLGICSSTSCSALNAVKNVLAGLVNAVAAIVFVVASEVAWGAAAMIAIGPRSAARSAACTARRLPPTVLRGIIVVVAHGAAVRLLAT